MKKLNIKLLLRRMLPVVALSVFISVSASGQSPQGGGPKTVSGTVVDENGQPVIGASIVARGASSVGTTSGADGRFSFAVPAGTRMVEISFMGMQTAEAPAATGITVVLNSAATELEQLVVVGYGMQKKVSLTGAVSSISNKDILTTKSPSLAVALAGKVPGLRIRQNNGMPGAFSTNINVRGMGTPLLVIDGVIRHETTEFQKLNPEDIESISVLKDASAAIYGINSQNGVILVKTKAGTSGPYRVTLNTNLGISKPTGHTKMMNSHQYWEILNENEMNSNGSPYFATREALEAAQALPNTDWYDQVFKSSALQQQYNLIVEGGNDKVSTYTSAGYMTDAGLLRSGDINYEKYSFRNGTTLRPHKLIKIEINLSGYSDLREQPGTWDDAFFYLNKAVHAIIPSEPVYANNNPLYFNRPSPNTDNPVLFSDKDKFGYRQWRDKFFQSTLAITLDIPGVEGLQAKLQGAYDVKHNVYTKVQKRVLTYRYNEDDDSYTSYGNYDPSIQEEMRTLSRFNLQTQLMYNRTFAEKHSVGAVAVFEAREDNSRYLNAKRFYEQDMFTTDNIDRAPITGQQTGGNTGKTTFLSVIGKFSYDYMSKYLVEFAFRRDGSYRYAPEQRWGFFPVVSGAWRISEENFVKNNISFLTNLKIRASWGRTGEDAGSAFQYIPGYVGYNGYVLGGGTYTSGYASSGLVNPYLTWVTSEMTNVGVDLTMWNGMLEFSADVYRRKRDGILGNRLGAVPNTFGATLPQENLNRDRTQGFELTIGHRNNVDDFFYGVTANMNFSRSKTTYQERAPFRSSMDRWRNGSVDRWHDVGWGYQVTGQYRSYDQIRTGVIETGAYANANTLPGDYIHLDVNGDGIISSADMMPIFWNGQPKATFGVTVYASWKGFDFNMLWQGAARYTAKYNEVLGNVLAIDASNSPAFYYDRWHRADVYDPDSEWIPGKYPATRRLDSDNGANRLESDIHRVNASYARLKNVEFGYSLPSKALDALRLHRVRVYVNLTNPLVICNKYLKNFDPEITDGNGFQYPLQKSYNFGIDITF